MAAERSLLMNVSKDEMDAIDEILQFKKPTPCVDEKTGEFHPASHFSSSPIRINVPINPSLETIGALCELKTAEINSTESADSEDGNSTDVGPDDFPQCLAALILLEHNYATSFSNTFERKENAMDLAICNLQCAMDLEKKSAPSPEKTVIELENSSISREETTNLNISPPVRRSKRQIEKLERELIEKEISADDIPQHEVKEDSFEKKEQNISSLIENSLNSKIENAESEGYCSNYKSFADFKKRHLKVIIEDCRYDKNLESKNILSPTLNTPQKIAYDSLNVNQSKCESTVDKEEHSSENSDFLKRRKLYCRTKFSKSKDVDCLEEIDVIVPSLRKRKFLKSEPKIENVLSVELLDPDKDKKGEDVKSNLPRRKIFNKKSGESETRQKDVGTGCKRQKRSSMSSDNNALSEGNTESIDTTQSTRRKKSVSFSDELVSINKSETSERKQTVVECKISLQKSIPSLITSPTTLTTKSQKKKVVRRESFRSVINEDEPPLFSQPDVMIKVKSDDAVSKKEEKESDQNLLDQPDVQAKIKFCEEIDKSNQSSNESIIDVESIVQHKISDPVNHHDQSSAVVSQPIKLAEPNSKDSCSIPDILIKPDTISENDKQELVTNALNIKNDPKDNVNSFSETCNNVADNNEPDVIENVTVQDCSFDNIDENLNDSKTEKVSAEHVFDDENYKPERKSRRLIKKKEFFGETLDSSGSKKSPGVQDMKQNAEKQNAGDKKCDHKGRGADTVKKEKNHASRYSDMDVDTDSDESEEDDPNKLWCICRKPHNSRFMIQCDKCEDWFHGSCVGVTKSIGRQLEKQKKEWMCPNCRITGESISLKTEKVLEDPVDSGKEAKKGSQGKDIKLNDQHLHNPTNKSGSDAIPGIEPITMRKDTLAQDKKLTQYGLIDESNSTKQENSVSSVEKTDENPNLKSLKSASSISSKQPMPLEIEASDLKSQSMKKKSAPVLQKAIAQHKSFNVSSKKQPVCLSQTMPPTKNVSPKGIQRNVTKQVHVPPFKKNKLSNLSKEKGVVIKKKHSCVQCQLEAKVNSCYCSDICIEKHAAQCLKSMRETKGTPKGAGFDSQRLVVFDRLKGNVITNVNGPTAGEIVSWLKANPSFMIMFTPSAKKESVSQKKECDSSTGAEKKDVTDEAAKATVRLNVRKTLKNILIERCKNADDIHLIEDDVQRMANKIEEELHSLFKDNSFKYRAKYRSLMFNIKDPRNQGLFRKILKGSIPPDRLVRMSSEELASMELARWREQENQHLLDLIKREQLEHQKTGSGLLLKKTHKGEVEIEDDLTSIIEQDVPKAIAKDIPEELVESEKEEVKNTTYLHRSHLFDLNCKICTGKIVPPPVDESIPKKVRVAHSISVDLHSPNASDSVEKSVLKIVEGKSPVSSTGDDSMDQEPTSTVSIGSPEISVKSSAKDITSKAVISVWKGFIFMQDIAKFVTSAYKVSGQTDQLRVDLPDTIQVCGRIIPDQVWDYLGKIKQSGNKELIIVRFQPANEEEAVAYHSFYSYLSSRKRYGVVSNYSKKIKDFYLLPLAAASPVPMVLVPFDGPGLPSPRPHLLLGVIVCHKFKQAPTTSTKRQPPVSKVEVEKTAGSYTPPHEPRSYTPPLPTLQSADESSKQEADVVYNTVSDLKKFSKLNKLPSIDLENETKLTQNKVYECLYTSPAIKTPSSDASTERDDDKPYDPEQDVLTLSSERKHRKDMHVSNEKSTQGSDNLEQHKKILDALTRQVEETDRQVNALKQLISLPEDELSVQTPNVSSLDINSVAETGMSSFLDLPENLQEILNAVRLKSHNKDKGTHEKGDVDMRIKDLFGKQFVEQKEDDISLPVYKVSGVSNLSEINDEVHSNEAYSPQEGTPPPNDENDRPSISCPSDPRIKLRTSFQAPPITSSGSPNVSLSTMSVSELVVHAQKQLMDEKNKDFILPHEQEPKSLSTLTTKLSSASWSTGKEPPPPGIELEELSSQKVIQTVSDPSVPTLYTSTCLTQDSSSLQVNSIFPQQTTSLPSRLPPGFSVHTPPPNIKYFPPPIVTTSYPPPPPVQVLPPKGNESNLAVEEPWPALQHSSYQPEYGEWKGKMSHWDETKVDDSRHSSERSNDYHSESFYKRGSTNRHWEKPQAYSRSHWNVHPQRGNKFESQRRGKQRTSFGRNQKN